METGRLNVGGGTRRTIVWFALATIAIVASAAVILSFGGDGVDAESEHFERTFPDDYVGTVWFTFAKSKRARQVTATWGRLQTSFVVPGGSGGTYLITKGAGKERAAPLQVDVEPATELTFNYGEAPPGGLDLSASPWNVLPYDSGAEPPRPANADSPRAFAAIDESVSYGGQDPTGIGVRHAPRREVAPFATVHHGQVFAVECWSLGEELTNSNLPGRRPRRVHQ